MHKRGTRPTLAERAIMEKAGYGSDFYLVVKNTPTILVIISKHRGTVYEIEKG